MTPDLTPEEESYLRNLLSNQSRGIRPLDISANLLLLAGGFLIVGTALYLARQMTDTAVYSVGLPNFIGGMLLIAGYIFLSRRVARMKRLTSILFKLSSNRVSV
jgi:uncharacterized membrane protein YgdD (TMEM256/DUF423 family)